MLEYCILGQNGLMAIGLLDDVIQHYFNVFF